MRANISRDIIVKAAWDFIVVDTTVGQLALQGHRFVTPLHRGSQRPIQEPSVSLERFRKAYQEYNWPFLPFRQRHPQFLNNMIQWNVTNLWWLGSLRCLWQLTPTNFFWENRPFRAAFGATPQARLRIWHSAGSGFRQACVATLLVSNVGNKSHQWLIDRISEGLLKSCGSFPFSSMHGFELCRAVLCTKVDCQLWVFCWFGVAFHFRWIYMHQKVGHFMVAVA